MKNAAALAFAAVTLFGLHAIAADADARLSRPGLSAYVDDGRLWVFRTGSPEEQAFHKSGPPEKSVAVIGGGPNGMTMKSADRTTIDEYLAAK